MSQLIKIRHLWVKDAHDPSTALCGESFAVQGLPEDVALCGACEDLKAFWTEESVTPASHDDPQESSLRRAADGTVERVFRDNLRVEAVDVSGLKFQDPALLNPATGVSLLSYASWNLFDGEFDTLVLRKSDYVRLSAGQKDEGDLDPKFISGIEKAFRRALQQSVDSSESFYPEFESVFTAAEIPSLIREGIVEITSPVLARAWRAFEVLQTYVEKATLGKKLSYGANGLPVVETRGSIQIDLWSRIRVALLAAQYAEQWAHFADQLVLPFKSSSQKENNE